MDLFQFYMAFPISNYDSEPVSDEEAMAAHYARVQQLQVMHSIGLRANVACKPGDRAQSSPALLK